MNEKKAILILDDHPMFREGLKAIVETVKDPTSEKLLFGLEPGSKNYGYRCPIPIISL